jgi:membrane complex biogenesis BtpA family protein
MCSVPHPICSCSRQQKCQNIRHAVDHEAMSRHQRLVTRTSTSDCPVSYGMVHLRASPGAPRSSHSVSQIVAIALQEADAYIKGGLNGLLIENMHDVPYMNRSAGPEVVATMACAAWELRRAFPSVPIGLQVLAGCNRESLAIAHACDCDFIRAESFVFGHVGDEGYMDACAGDLLRYRRAIGACSVRVFTDVKKKHSAHAVTADVSIAETSVAAAFFDVDGVIVTGKFSIQPVRFHPIPINLFRQQHRPRCVCV